MWQPSRTCHTKIVKKSLFLTIFPFKNESNWILQNHLEYWKTFLITQQTLFSVKIIGFELFCLLIINHCHSEKFFYLTTINQTGSSLTSWQAIWNNCCSVYSVKVQISATKGERKNILSGIFIRQSSLDIENKIITWLLIATNKNETRIKIWELQ